MQGAAREAEEDRMPKRMWNYRAKGRKWED